MAAREATASLAVSSERRLGWGPLGITMRRVADPVRWRLGRISARSCLIGGKPVTSTSTEAEEVESLIESPGLAGALESERFKTFLDHVPIAIAVSELRDPEVIVYANPEFERVSGLGVSALERQYWDILEGEAVDEPKGLSLVSAILERSDGVGRFKMQGSE